MRTLIIAIFLCSAATAANIPLIDSSVKLRVDAADSHSWGTGTIIDTRSGEALVLTCGHIFRDSQGRGSIEVHLFHDNSTVTVFGRCLYYDLEIDLALVAIRPPCAVKAVSVAPENAVIQPNQQVFSVGCDGGGQPTVRTHTVMSTDRLSTPANHAVPFHYVQVSGAPVSGRSGGGLFSADGYLIGVCNTADPVANDGQFVPPEMIRYILDKRNLTDVYKPVSDRALARAGTIGTDSTEANSAGAKALSLTRLSNLKPLEPIQPVIADVQPKTAAPVSPITTHEQATLEEIQRLRQDGNEIVVIVKSRRNPDVPIDVIYLNNTSGEFAESLAKNVSLQEDNSQVIFSSSNENAAAPRGLRPVSMSIKH
jgi:S1-C subfamily serine protease